jgi:methionyl-tRNA formyltransferase
MVWTSYGRRIQNIVKILFAGKYCKNLSLEKFKEYEHVSIGEYDDYNPHLESSDIIISYGYGNIFKNKALNKKIFNLHPSVLPYGRGLNPLVWSIYYGHPIGYTIYQINSNRIDEGFIYSSKEIKYDLNQTFKDLFIKVTKSAEDDFIKNFKEYFNNQSYEEIKDEENLHYKNKNDSKIIMKYLKDGWNTKIVDFLEYTKNKNLY